MVSAVQALAFVALAAMTVLLAAALLPACGLAGAWAAWLRFCPSPVAADPAQDGAAAAAARRDALEVEIAALERRLGALPCPTPAAAPEPPAEAPPDPAPAEAPIDADRWRERDVGLLEGCWNLDSDYRLFDNATQSVVGVRSWEACFDAAGGGRQTVVFENGVTCSGPIGAEFDGGGRLVLRDGGDVPCDQNRHIIARTISCELNDAGTADCNSRDRRSDGPGQPVRLRR